MASFWKDPRFQEFVNNYRQETKGKPKATAPPAPFVPPPREAAGLVAAGRDVNTRSALAPPPAPSAFPSPPPLPADHWRQEREWNLPPLPQPMNLAPYGVVRTGIMPIPLAEKGAAQPNVPRLAPYDFGLSEVLDALRVYSKNMAADSAAYKAEMAKPFAVRAGPKPPEAAPAHDPISSQFRNVFEFWRTLFSAPDQQKRTWVKVPDPETGVYNLTPVDVREASAAEKAFSALWLLPEGMIGRWRQGNPQANLLPAGVLVPFQIIRDIASTAGVFIKGLVWDDNPVRQMVAGDIHNYQEWAKTFVPTGFGPTGATPLPGGKTFGGAAAVRHSDYDPDYWTAKDVFANSLNDISKTLGVMHTQLLDHWVPALANTVAYQRDFMERMRSGEAAVALRADEIKKADPSLTLEQAQQQAWTELAEREASDHPERHLYDEGLVSGAGKIVEAANALWLAGVLPGPGGEQDAYALVLREVNEEQVQRALETAVVGFKLVAQSLTAIDPDFSYTWALFPDREQKFLAEKAQVEPQLGRSLTPSETVRLKARHEDAPTELVGQAIFDLSWMVPQKVWDTAFEAAMVPLKALGRGAKWGVMRVPIVKDAVEWLGRETTLSTMRKVGNRAARVFGVIGQAANNAESMGEILDELIHLQNIPPTWGISQSLDVIELERVIPAEDWPEIFDNAYEAATEIVQEAAVARGVPRSQVSKLKPTRAQVIQKIADNFEAAFVAPFEVRAGKKIESFLSRNLATTFTNLRGAWIEGVLSMRPGWTVYNAFDSQLRMLLLGAKPFQDLNAILETTEMPRQIYERFPVIEAGAELTIADIPSWGPFGYMRRGAGRSVFSEERWPLGPKSWSREVMTEKEFAAKHPLLSGLMDAAGWKKWGRAFREHVNLANWNASWKEYNAAIEFTLAAQGYHTLYWRNFGRLDERVGAELLSRLPDATLRDIASRIWRESKDNPAHIETLVAEILYGQQVRGRPSITMLVPAEVKDFLKGLPPDQASALTKRVITRVRIAIQSKKFDQDFVKGLFEEIRGELITEHASRAGYRAADEAARGRGTIDPDAAANVAKGRVTSPDVHEEILHAQAAAGIPEAQAAILEVAPVTPEEIHEVASKIALTGPPPTNILVSRQGLYSQGFTDQEIHDWMARGILVRDQGGIRFSDAVGQEWSRLRGPGVPSPTEWMKNAMWQVEPGGIGEHRDITNYRLGTTLEFDKETGIWYVSLISPEGKAGGVIEAGNLPKSVRESFYSRKAGATAQEIDSLASVVNPAEAADLTARMTDEQLIAGLSDQNQARWRRGEPLLSVSDEGGPDFIAQELERRERTRMRIDEGMVPDQAVAAAEREVVEDATKAAGVEPPREAIPPDVPQVVTQDFGSPSVEGPKPTARVDPLTEEGRSQILSNIDRQLEETAVVTDEARLAREAGERTRVSSAKFNDILPRLVPGVDASADLWAAWSDLDQFISRTLDWMRASWPGPLRNPPEYRSRYWRGYFNLQAQMYDNAAKWIDELAVAAANGELKAFQRPTYVEFLDKIANFDLHFDEAGRLVGFFDRNKVFRRSGREFSVNHVIDELQAFQLHGSPEGTRLTDRFAGRQAPPMPGMPPVPPAPVPGAPPGAPAATMEEHGFILQNVGTADVKLNPGFQPRDTAGNAMQVDSERVRELARVWDWKQYEPLKLNRVGADASLYGSGVKQGDLVLMNGHHRYAAAIQAGHPMMPAQIYELPFEDAKYVANIGNMVRADQTAFEKGRIFSTRMALGDKASDLARVVYNDPKRADLVERFASLTILTPSVGSQVGKSSWFTESHGFALAEAVARFDINPEFQQQIVTKVLAQYTPGVREFREFLTTFGPAQKRAVQMGLFVMDESWLSEFAKTQQEVSRLRGSVQTARRVINNPDLAKDLGVDLKRANEIVAELNARQAELRRLSGLDPAIPNTLQADKLAAAPAFRQPEPASLDDVKNAYTKVVAESEIKRPAAADAIAVNLEHAAEKEMSPADAYAMALDVDMKKAVDQVAQATGQTKDDIVANLMDESQRIHEPALAKGKTRLYRPEINGEVVLPDEILQELEQAGASKEQWWTESKKEAEEYAGLVSGDVTITYRDVPKVTVEKSRPTKRITTEMRMPKERLIIPKEEIAKGEILPEKATRIKPTRKVATEVVSEPQRPARVVAQAEQAIEPARDLPRPADAAPSVSEAESLGKSRPDTAVPRAERRPVPSGQVAENVGGGNTKGVRTSSGIVSVSADHLPQPGEYVSAEHLRDTYARSRAHALKGGASAAKADEQSILFLEHQVDNTNRAFSKWDRSKGFVIADGTGTGKTYSAVLAVDQVFERGGNRVVLVAPNDTIIRQWQDVAEPLGIEIRSFKTGKGVPGGKIDFGTRRGVIYATTYNTMQRWHSTSTLAEMLGRGQLDLLIFDESHYLKNAYSGVSTALAGIELQGHADHVLFMSATALESPVHYLYMADALGVHNFEAEMASLGIHKETVTVTRVNRFGKEVEREEEVWRGITPEKLAALNTELVSDGAYIRHEMSYRANANRKTGELLRAYSSSVPCPVNDSFAEMYNGFQKITSKFKRGQKPHFVAQLEAQRVAIGRSILEQGKLETAIRIGQQKIGEGESVAFFVWRKEGSKFEEHLTDFLHGKKEYARGSPLPAYYQALIDGGVKFESPIDALQRAFPNAVVVSGDVVGGARDLAIRNFQDGKADVAIVTVGAGGVGLSLHDLIGGHPRVQINITLPYTGLGMDQLAGRTFRYGSQSHGEIYWLYVDTALEQKYVKRTMTASERMGALIRGEEQLAGEADMLDFQFAIEDDFTPSPYSALPSTLTPSTVSEYDLRTMTTPPWKEKGWTPEYAEGFGPKGAIEKPVHLPPEQPTIVEPPIVEPPKAPAAAAPPTLVETPAGPQFAMFGAPPAETGPWLGLEGVQLDAWTLEAKKRGWLSQWQETAADPQTFYAAVRKDRDRIANTMGRQAAAEAERLLGEIENAVGAIRRSVGSQGQFSMGAGLIPIVWPASAIRPGIRAQRTEADAALANLHNVLGALDEWERYLLEPDTVPVFNEQQRNSLMGWAKEAAAGKAVVRDVSRDGMPRRTILGLEHLEGPQRAAIETGFSKAQKFKVIDTIEELAIDGLKDEEIAARIADRMKGLSQQEIREAVISTRMKLGMARPGANDFEAWQQIQKALQRLRVLGIKDVKGALPEVLRGAIDYSRERNVESIAKIVYPFFKFPERSIPWWIETIATHPEILAWWMRYQKMSERYAFQYGAVTSMGQQLNRLKGYVPVPYTDYWINPLAPMSAKLVLPDYKAEFGDETEPDTPFQAAVGYIYEHGQQFGFNAGPWIEYPLRWLNAIDSEKYPNRSVLPAIELVPPWVQRDILEKLRRMTHADWIPDTWSPQVPWQDFLIERQVLMHASDKMTEVPEADKVRLAVEARTAVKEREGNLIWDAAQRKVEATDYYQRLVGFFTGIYPKQFTDAEAELYRIRNEILFYKDMVNDEVGATIFGLDPSGTVREDHYQEKRYDTSEGNLYGLYSKIGWTRTPTEGQLYGERRRQYIAEGLEKDEQTNARNKYIDNALKELQKDLNSLPVGAPSELKNKAYADYSTARSEADRLFPQASRPWSNPGAHSEETLLDHVRNLWFQQIWETKPTWDRDKETYTKYQERVAQWQKDLPDIAQSILRIFVEHQLDGIQLPSKLPDFLRETTPENILEWQKRNDTPIDALNRVWDKNYWSVYWDSLEGKTGYARDLAEMRFKMMWPQGPTLDTLWQWVQAEYGTRFTKQEIAGIFNSTGAMTTDQRLGVGKTDLQNKQEQIWLWLAWVGPNKKALRDAMQQLGANPDWIDLWYLTEGNASSWREGEFDKFFTTVAAAAGGLGLKDPTEAQLGEWSAAQGLNDQYRKEAETLYGSNIWNISAQYAQLSAGEKATYRKEHPELAAFWDFREQFATDHPLWAEYYMAEGWMKNRASGGSGGYARSGYARSSASTQVAIQPAVPAAERSSLDVRDLLLSSKLGKGRVQKLGTWPTGFMKSVTPKTASQVAKALKTKTPATTAVPVTPLTPDVVAELAALAKKVPAWADFIRSISGGPSQAQTLANARALGSVLPGGGSRSK